MIKEIKKIKKKYKGVKNQYGQWETNRKVEKALKELERLRGQGWESITL